MWFTEDALSPMILCGGIGVILAFIGVAQQKVKLLIVAALLGIACLVINVMEQRVVTEAELVEQKIYDLADAFHRNDQPAVQSFFSAQNSLLQGVAATAVELVDIDDDYRITDVHIQTKAEETLAESHFRANVTADVQGQGNVGRQPTRWKVDWRKEAGDWKITQVTRLSVVGDNEMGILDRKK